jgi:hypothetical protein
MTLTVLMYAMMMATFAVLAGLLVVDAVRALSRRPARRAADRTVPHPRSAAAGARSRGVVPTRS